jgi:hypothetical protein
LVKLEKKMTLNSEHLEGIEEMGGMEKYMFLQTNAGTHPSLKRYPVYSKTAWTHRNLRLAGSGNLQTSQISQTSRTHRQHGLTDTQDKQTPGTRRQREFTNIPDLTDIPDSQTSQTHRQHGLTNTLNSQIL